MVALFAQALVIGFLAFQIGRMADSDWSLSTIPTDFTDAYQDLIPLLTAPHLLIFLSFGVGVIMTRLYFFQVREIGDHRGEAVKNGVSVVFGFKLLASGFSYQALLKLTATRTRRRVYTGFKRFVFFGKQIWFAGHPAVARHVFSPKNQGLFYKVDKTSLNKLLFQQDEPNNAMLYTGDDDRWKHARQDLTPYFMTTNFDLLDENIDDVINKHLGRILKRNSGRAELLELMLYVTIDLLCELLYGCTLSEADLAILVDSLAEFTVPQTEFRGNYPNGLSCIDYHRMAAREMADKAPKGTLAHILLHECPTMSESLRYENCAFFLEALTPAFASFWTISCICMSSGTDKKIKEKATNDATFRQQCIKEAMRMYPPVPTLWARVAKKTHTFANPLYDPLIPPSRSWFPSIFGEPDIRTQKDITIPEGTHIFCFPPSFHYDDRMWLRPDEFIPSRWDNDPSILDGRKVAVRQDRSSQWYGLTARKSKLRQSKLHAEKKSSNSKKAYSLDASSDVPLRYKIFGTSIEQEVEDVNDEHLTAVMNCDDLSSWSFFPFGLGKHTCLGRRLAVRLVDSIVSNLLSHGANFENGVVPALFTQKDRFERVNATSGVYYYPAEPVYIEVEKVSVKVTAAERRKTSFLVPIMEE